MPCQKWPTQAALAKAGIQSRMASPCAIFITTALAPDIMIMHEDKEPARLTPEQLARVVRAWGKIEAGDYSHPDVLDVTVERLLTVLRELDACPQGVGEPFHDLAVEAIALNLGDLVDHAPQDRERRVRKRRLDHALPLRLENLGGRSTWGIWQREYRVDSIIVEVKNYKETVGCAAVDQLLGYLASCRRGRLGMLVSRHGFSTGAMDHMACLAGAGTCLILPLTVKSLRDWSLGCYTPLEKDGFLRQIKNDLVRAA